MVDGILFDKLAAIATALKKKPGVPFGGIQVSDLLFFSTFLIALLISYLSSGDSSSLQGTSFSSLP